MPQQTDSIIASTASAAPSVCPITNADMTDTLAQPIIVPRTLAVDTILDIDLDNALNARYDVSGIDIEALTIVPPPEPTTWVDGLPGTVRVLSPGDNSGVLLIVSTMFVLILLSYRKCRKLFTTMFKELLATRQRPNVFDVHTSNETWVQTLMQMQWCVYSGLLVYTAFATLTTIPPDHILRLVMAMIGLTSAYYIFKVCAYNVLGYTFADNTGRVNFIHGYNASQSLLGFGLVIPALVALFYPTLAIPMLITAAILTLTARILFIIKGFRIFYDKISDLLYFILYLCTLEIMPLIVLYDLALMLVDSAI